MAWKLPCQSFWLRMVFTKPTGSSGDSWVLNTETDWSEHICALLGRSGSPGHLSLVKAVLRMLLAHSGLPLESFPSFSNFSTTLKPPQVSKRSESPQLIPSVFPHHHHGLSWCEYLYFLRWIWRYVLVLHFKSSSLSHNCTFFGWLVGFFFSPRDSVSVCNTLAALEFKEIHLPLSRECWDWLKVCCHLKANLPKPLFFWVQRNVLKW